MNDLAAGCFMNANMPQGSASDNPPSQTPATPAVPPVASPTPPTEPVTSAGSTMSSSPAASVEEQLQSELQQELAKALGGDKTIEQLMEEASKAQTTAPTDDATKTSTSGGKAGREPQEFHQELVRARIIRISGDDVFVELPGVGGKNQGVVPVTQFERPPRLGSIMEFVVQSVDEAQGLMHLSREGAASRATWEQLQRGAVVDARVVNVNKGGLELEMIGGIRAFMPASQVDLHHIEDFSTMVGQKLTAVVQEIERKSRKVVLSRRTYLEMERKRAAEKVMGQLEVGQVREGKVTSLMEYGAFVDIGGIDGLVHVSDMSYSRVDKPSDLLKVGQDVRVKVLKIDTEKKRISLGLKQVAPDPWEGVESSLRVGEMITGRVTRVADFGAFVELKPGVEGLCPASEMTWRRHQRPSEMVKEGDTLKLMVMALEPGKRRLTFSLKQAGGNPWAGAAAKYPKMGVVSGTVLSTTEFGAFVELEAGVEGLVHISELSDKRINAVTDVIKVGEKHEYRVLEIDEPNRRIRLSLKAVKNPPVEETPKAEAAAGANAGPGKPGSPAKPAPKKVKPKNLKSGLGDNAAMGMGLGQLRL